MNLAVRSVNAGYAAPDDAAVARDPTTPTATSHPCATDPPIPLGDDSVC